jgi:hypothetical protein
VWQEPDATGVARIWARRLFGSVPGNVLEATPETFNGQPITADADMPAVAFNDYNEALVAYRLQGGAGSPFGHSQLFMNTLPSSIGLKASDFLGASPVGGDINPVAPDPSVDDVGNFTLDYTSGGAVRTLAGNDLNVGTPKTLGTGSAPVLSSLDPAHGSTTAWLGTDATGLPVISVSQALPGSGTQQAALSAPISGPVQGLSLGASGLGDALIGFSQGPLGQQQVMGALVRSPPQPFLISAPAGWVSPQSAVLEWDPASDALGQLSYSVLVDGQVRIGPMTGLSTRLDLRGLGNGVHQVQVRATDPTGQQVLSSAGTIDIDASPPTVRATVLRSGRVQVSVSDTASGVRTAATVIHFGDGSRLRGRTRAVHGYTRPGTYTITVSASDRIGLTVNAHLRVVVGR